MPAGDDGPFADTVTLEQKTSSIGGTSGRISLWMQWMLPKVTVKLFAPEPTVKKAGTTLSHSSLGPSNLRFLLSVTHSRV